MGQNSGRVQAHLRGRERGEIPTLDVGPARGLMRQVEMGAGRGYTLMEVVLGAYAEYSKQLSVKKGKKWIR